MAPSGRGTFGDENIEAFGRWIPGRPRTVGPGDYMYWDGAGFCWLDVRGEGYEGPRTLI